VVPATGLGHRKENLMEKHSSVHVTFPTGPYVGWSLTVIGVRSGGRTVRIVVLLETPRIGGERRQGVLNFRPDTPGWEVMARALADSGVSELEFALEWVMDSTREALTSRADIDPDTRAFWGAIVDGYERALERYFGPDSFGRVPAFEELLALAGGV